MKNILQEIKEIDYLIKVYELNPNRTVDSDVLPCFPQRQLDNAKKLRIKLISELEAKHNLTNQKKKIK